MHSPMLCCRIFVRSSLPEPQVKDPIVDSPVNDIQNLVHLHVRDYNAPEYVGGIAPKLGQGFQTRPTIS